MSKLITQNIIRFVVCLFAQVLIFKSIAFSVHPFNYGAFIIYPLFIFLLPLNVPKAVVILSSFFLGLGVDMFYDSPGVHASACVFTAYIRPIVLRAIAPVEGYKKMNESPSSNNLGFIWFATYAGILLALHLLFYFSVEAFTFVFFIDILLKVIISFIFSIGIYFLHQIIFRTRY